MIVNFWSLAERYRVLRYGPIVGAVACIRKQKLDFSADYHLVSPIQEGD